MCGETKSRSATSRLVNPCATSRATASSESVIAAQPRPGRCAATRRRRTPSALNRPRTLPASQVAPAWAYSSSALPKMSTASSAVAIVDSGGAKVIQRCRERQGAGAALVEFHRFAKGLVVVIEQPSCVRGRSGDGSDIGVELRALLGRLHGV